MKDIYNEVVSAAVFQFPSSEGARLDVRKGRGGRRHAQGIIYLWAYRIGDGCKTHRYKNILCSLKMAKPMPKSNVQTMNEYIATGFTPVGYPKCHHPQKTIFNYPIPHP